MNTSTSNPVSCPTVAIQGIHGCFHEIAAHKFLGDNLCFETCDSFPELFRAAKAGRVDYSTMAIENSVAGAILPNYALLRESNLSIIGELYLRISHYLLALPGQSIHDITEVHSHPMALQQCQDFFAQYPHIHLVERADTAASALWVQEHQKQGVAAIASEACATYYDLEILASEIESNKRNFTRFFLLVDKSMVGKFPITPNKSSISFNLAARSEQVGSLSQVLMVLSSHGMNLTKIQSLPIIGQEWEYFFHVDLEFEDHAQFHRSLDAIIPLVSDLKILGEYARGDKTATLLQEPFHYSTSTPL